MKKRIAAFVLAGMLVSGSVIVSTAGTILDTTYGNSGNSVDWLEVPSVETWTTNSALMVGMTVTATTSTGTYTETWGVNGVSWTGTDDNYWELYLETPANSTFVTPFVLNVRGDLAIQNLLIQGEHGNTMFDVSTSLEGSPDSTVNSRDGVPFADSYQRPGVDGSGNPITVTVTDSVVYTGESNVSAYYYTPINLPGQDPFYDLYSNLSLTFDGGGFLAGDTLTFISDTDNGGVPVPEPSTLLLFVIGATALVGSRGSRKK